MFLTDIPNELIFIIIKNLCEKNYHNLVCKQFNYIIKSNCKIQKLYTKNYCSIHENLKEIENKLLYLNFV